MEDSLIPSGRDTGLQPTRDSSSSPSRAGEADRQAAAENSRSQSSQGERTEKGSTVTKACVRCRERHLKCDGLQPCSRCKSLGSECVFIASRRGLNNSRSKPVPRPEQSAREQSHDLVANPATSYALPTSTTCSTFTGGTLWGPPSTVATLWNDPDPMITSFYYHFYPAHPFVLPRHYLTLISGDALAPVLASMRWIGSLYAGQRAPNRAALLSEAESYICNPLASRDGFLVQAMILLVVGLDGMGERHKALKMLRSVEELALEIKLHSQEFPTLQSLGMPVVEESWRRTWWELYIVDGLIAGVHRESNFALWDVATEVALPCEEGEYLSGLIPPSYSLRDLEDGQFSKDNPRFSSYAYRILSTRILGHLIRLPAICSPKDPAIQKIDTLLTNWKLQVPLSKQDALRRDGAFDEMMFQAYMITHTISIILHQPFTNCALRPVQMIDACSAPPDVNLTDEEVNTHTLRMNKSASDISAMITSGAPLLSHTHFFTCALTASSIVHLSRWVMMSSTEDDQDLRQNILLNMGALKKRASVWSSAQRAHAQVAAVAKEAYDAKKKQRPVEEAISSSLLEDFLLDGNEELLSLPLLTED